MPTNTSASRLSRIERMLEGFIDESRKFQREMLGFKQSTHRSFRQLGQSMMVGFGKLEEDIVKLKDERSAVEFISDDEETANAEIDTLNDSDKSER